MDVVVAMSGGVDSSVAAAMLLKAGHRVTGVTLLMEVCSAEHCDEASMARQVANLLGIDHHEIDCRREFEKLVLLPCWSEYDRGRTPNPCGICNPRVKFAALLEQARKLSADRIATGHHARIEITGAGPALLRGRDTGKDQSYFLFGLSAEQLATSLFPVGDLTKSRVREIARELNLPNANQEESQDACFAAGGEEFPEELRNRFDQPSRPGQVRDEQGQLLGQHSGFHRFTIGQRRGLGISVGKRSWVKAIDAETATVIMTSDWDRLLSSGLLASNLVWGPRFFDFPGGRVEVQVRSRHEPAPATLVREKDTSVRVQFDEPQRAVTPGQAVVFYLGERLIGGGWIEETLA